jgi:transposase
MPDTRSARWWYHRSNLMVQDFAKSLNIELLYLPSYSPNLNLIERIWKFIKKKCLYSIYYSDFDSFKQSITGGINKTGGEYKKELDSMLSLNFQMFSESHIMTV